MPHNLLLARRLASLALLAAFSLSCASAPRDPDAARPPGAPAALLPSWNETPTKARILDFIAKATDEASPQWVPRERRVAVFDLDGTLIVERPDYIEVLVAVEALREELTKDPSLATRQPWRAVAEKDASYWRQNADEVLLTAAEGERLSDYHRQVVRFLSTATHPRLHQTYASLFYRPMVELMDLLRARGFLIYLVSASQQEYMRAFSQACLGVSAPRVIGSMVAFQANEDVASGFVRKDAWWQPMSDGDGKAERIRERIAIRPIFAAGNSGGDQEMLELTHTSDPSLVLLVDHDDAEREFRYANEEILAEADADGWVKVSMKEDWAEIFGHRCSW